MPARGGSSPLLPGGLGISLPALRPACEVHRWMCHMGWRGSCRVSRVCHEAWPRLSLGMKYSHWQRAVVERPRASAPCEARAARKCGGLGSAFGGVPLSFSFFLIVAQSTDREMPVTTAGILWRRSVRRAEKFPSRDDDSGADRTARTMNRVIAGLVARPCHLNRDGRNKSGHDGEGKASLRGPKDRSNPGAACVERWIASRSLSSGRATSRGPVGSQ